MARSLRLEDPRGRLPPLETPCVVSYTEIGLLPYTTPDMTGDFPLYLNMADMHQNFLPKNVPVPTALGHTPRWIFFGPASEYFVFEDAPSKTGVKVYGRNGAVKAVSADDYRSLVEQIQPQGLISMYSSTTSFASNRQKKLRQNASTDFLVKCPNTISFTPPDSTDKESGLVFDFGNLNNEVRELIQNSIKGRDSSLPRIALCDGHPNDILELIEMGIDIIVPRLPLIYTKKGYAFTFDVNSRDKIDGPLAINLLERRFEHDHTPVVDGCDCLGCRRHKRSYLHHLLNVHEMLADTLLIQHNTRQIQLFVENARKRLSGKN